MIVLDTNVLSELMNPNPARPIQAWIAQHPVRDLFTTSISEAEIFYGIERLNPGKKREGLLTTAEAIFNEDFVGRIFDFDSDAARAYSKILAYRRKLGKPMSHEDAQIAAIVRVRDAKLATRNIADFQDCNIELIDPWNSP